VNGPCLSQSERCSQLVLILTSQPTLLPDLSEIRPHAGKYSARLQCSRADSSAKCKIQLTRANSDL
jgi:hypothetical protein